MEYQCVLQGACFIITFNIKHISKKYLDIIIHFAVDAVIQKMEIKSVPGYVTVNELLESGFKIQAQTGDYAEDGTGYISLLILLNIGFQIDSDNARLYIGGNVIVSIIELDIFLQMLRATYQAVRHAQGTMA